MSAPPENEPSEDDVRSWVRSRYARFALGEAVEAPSPVVTIPHPPAECCAAGSCAESLGYRPEELASIPEGSNLGLGCGNPTALAALRPGEVVLDLGSGAGGDAFLAARKVGPSGRVIGVDMTPEMLERARANATNGHYVNVEFRLGEIERLPAADASVDVVLSNCVINLSADKAAVYREAFRVLRPGGRLMVSDMVATRPIPAAARENPALWASCSSGALPASEVESLLRAAGFEEVAVVVHATEPPTASLEDPAALGVFPAEIRGRKPVG